MSAAAFGFDVGGQSVKGALVSADGDILAQSSRPTGPQTSGESLAEALASLRDEIGRAGAADVPIGVGLAGVLDRSGVFRGGPHLPRILGTRIGELLAQRLGADVAIHNDADCAAMAEGWRGAVEGCDDFLLLTIGTGIGSGLVLGGELRVGASGYGCEFGHTTVVHGGRLCGCGNRGCLEAYISETAAMRLVEEAPEALRTRIAERRRAHGGGVAQAVFELGAAGDGDIERIGAAMVEMLGGAIGSVVNVLDLTTIVLGGGIAPGVLARLDLLRAAAAQSLFARSVEDLTIVAAAGGPFAGAIGAARLGMIAAQRKRGQRAAH